MTEWAFSGSGEASVDISYSIEDVNNSIRFTNNLLRAANNLRLTIRDFQRVAKNPNIANVVWTLVQLSRTINAFRRIYRLISMEVKTGASLAGLISGMVVPSEPTEITGTPTPFDISRFAVRVDAFRENLPMRLEELDLADLPPESATMIQGILEEDAQQTVYDAKRLLQSRILHPERSTGFLETSIGWMPEIDGVRIYANAPYAWWVEEGHQTFRGHHYLHDAIQMTSLRLPEKIKAEINGLILGETH